MDTNCKESEMEEIVKISEDNIRDIVSHLEDELFEKLGEDYDGEIFFAYGSIGVASNLEFLGYQIWDSEDDGYEITAQDIVDKVNKLLKLVQDLGRFTCPKEEN